MSEAPNDKTLYDGRLLTHQRLNSGWNAYGNFLLVPDYARCVTALKMILTYSAGALKPESIKKYRDKLQGIRNKAMILNNGSKVNPNSVSNSIIEDELSDFSIDLMIDTKNLYLPYELNETEFDENKFLNESG